MVCYGLEYFAFEGDSRWTESDARLLAMAKRELLAIGLAVSSEIVDCVVVRQPKTSPIYDEDYAEPCATIRQELEARFQRCTFVV
jgi:protoporphyrinogen oxidase